MKKDTPWQMDLQTVSTIKEGGNCTVSVCNGNDGKSYLVKTYQAEYLNQARNEFLFLQAVKNEHIPQALAFESTPQPRIIMSYIEGETFSPQSLLNVNKPEALYAQLAYDIAQIHAAGICLNDIKPDNLILNNKALHIVDFGMATINLHYDRLYRGTVAYASPEKVLRQSNHFAADVFSLGMTIFFARHGKTVADYVNEAEYRMLLGNAELWHKQIQLMEQDTLIQSMLSYQPGNRPTALEVATEMAGRAHIRLKGIDKTVAESYIFKSQLQAVELLQKKNVLHLSYADEPQKIEGLLALSSEMHGNKLLILDESLFLTQPEEFFAPFPVGYRDNNVYQTHFLQWLMEQPVSILLRRHRQIKPTGFFEDIATGTKAMQIWLDEESGLKPVPAGEITNLLAMLPSLDSKKPDIRKQITTAKPLLIRTLIMHLMQAPSRLLDANELTGFLSWIGTSIPLLLVQQVWDNWHLLVNDALLKRNLMIEGNSIRAEVIQQGTATPDKELLFRITDLAVKSNLYSIAAEVCFRSGDRPNSLKYWSVYIDELIKSQFFVSAYEYISQLHNRLPSLPFELRKKEAFLARICGHFQHSYELYQLLITESEGLMKAVLSVDQAIVLQSLERHDEAIQAYRDAIDLFRIHKDIKALLRALNNLGVVFFELKRYADAEQVFNDVLAEARLHENVQFETISYINLSDIQLKRGEWKRVLYYAEKALIITQSNQKWNLFFNASTIAARAHIAMGEREKAFTLLENVCLHPKAVENVLQYQETLAWYLHFTQIYNPADTDRLLSSIAIDDTTLHNILMREFFFIQLSRRHYLQAYRYLQSLSEVSILKSFFDSDTDTLIKRLKELKTQPETDSYLYYLTHFLLLFPQQATKLLAVELQEALDLFQYHPLQYILTSRKRTDTGMEDWAAFIETLETSQTVEQAVQFILHRLAEIVEADKYAWLEPRNGVFTAVQAIDREGNPLADSRLFLSQSIVQHIARFSGYSYLYPAYHYASADVNSSALGLGISTVVGYAVFQEDKLTGIFYCDKNDGSDYDASTLSRVRVLFTIAHKAISTLLNLTKQKQKDELAGIDSIEQQTHQMIGNSKVMQEIYARIDLVAGYDVNVLITGPTGSGKELVARAIHNRYIEKHKGMTKPTFVAVNCAAIPEQLLESELFGYKKGAFTGAYSDKKGKILAADKGTLFLDEIGDMPLLLQSKLLRVIQDRLVSPLGSETEFPVNVRLIAATNQNLEERVAQGLFRPDLFYRLKVVSIELPSLSDRKEDIPLLAMHLIRKFSAKFNKKIDSIHPAALQYLQAKVWNGNVRELENEMERAVLLCNQDFLTVQDFSVETDNSSGAIFRNLPLEWQDFRDYKQRISDELDKRYIRQLLSEAGDNIMTASKLGKLERMQVYRLMKKDGDEGK